MTDTLSTSFKEFSNTLYALKGLAKELEKERDVIVTSAGQISSCTRQFQTSLQDYKELSPKVIEQINTSIHESAQVMAKKAAEETVRLLLEKSANRIDESLANIDRKSNHINHEMSQTLRRMSMFSKGIVIAILMATLFGGLIGGGLVHYLFPPISAQTGAQLEAGSLLLKAWPKLSQKERERISSFTK